MQSKQKNGEILNSKIQLICRGWGKIVSLEEKTGGAGNYQSGITKNHISSMTKHSISLFCI